MLKYKAVADWGDAKVYFPFEVNRDIGQTELSLLAMHICERHQMYYSHFEKVEE